MSTKLELCIVIDNDKCAWECRFKHDTECLLFKEPLNKIGYYDSYELGRCRSCLILGDE